MSLRISRMETRQNSSRDPYDAGGGYVGRSGGASFFFEVDVTFIADGQGVYELQRASVDRSGVSVVPGSTGYSEQCRRYEDEIAELKKQLEEATRNLVKATTMAQSFEQQRAQATKERDVVGLAPVRKAPPEPSRFTAIELDEDE